MYEYVLLCVINDINDINDINWYIVYVLINLWYCQRNDSYWTIGNLAIYNLWVIIPYITSMKEFMVLPGIHVVYPPIGISYGISMDELLYI